MLASETRLTSTQPLRAKRMLERDPLSSFLEESVSTALQGLGEEDEAKAGGYAKAKENEGEGEEG